MEQYPFYTSGEAKMAVDTSIREPDQICRSKIRGRLVGGYIAKAMSVYCFMLLVQDNESNVKS